MDEKIEITEKDVLQLQNELITSNNMVKILCSICNCETVDRYIETLQNLTYLHDYEKEYLATFNSLKAKLEKVPTYKTLLYELGVKSWESETYDDELYTIEELDELFILLEKKNIEHKISLLVKDFVADIKKGKFNECILDDMCNYNILLHTNQNINDCYDDLKSIYDNFIDRKPILTGIKELDENEIDFAKGELTSLMGATGGFKTTFMTNLAYNKLKEGRNVVYLSLEETKANMYFNILSLHSTDKKFSTHIPHSELKRSLLTEEQKKILFNDIYEDFKKYKKHLALIDSKDIGLNSFSNYTKLLSKMDKQFIKETGSGVDIIIVDHIQMLKNNNDLIGNNSYELVSKWVDYFRRNTIDFLGTGRTIATFVVSQVSRKGQEDSDRHYGKYSLSAFADSSELERQSANVFSIKTDYTMFTSEIAFSAHKYRNLELKDKTIHIKMTPEYYAFKKVSNTDIDILTDNQKDNIDFDKLYKRKESIDEFIMEDTCLPEIDFSQI